MSYVLVKKRLNEFAIITPHIGAIRSRGLGAFILVKSLIPPRLPKRAKNTAPT